MILSYFFKIKIEVTIKKDINFIKICKKLGKHIKNIRNDQHLTLQELSLKTGIRIEYLKKIEDGNAYGILIDKHMLKIANALKTSMHELLDI